jgi:hypothetical protein
MKKLLAMWVTVLVLSTLGYSASAAPQHGSTAPAKPHSMSADDDAEPSLSGKVVETMNAGGYTYVLLEKNGKKTWVAVSEMKVTVGKEMAFRPGAPMSNFTSKSLNRTFDVIYFSGGPVTAASAGKTTTDTATGSKAAVSAPEKAVKVEKAAGANAYTVAEVYQKAAELNGKTAVVKGKVVKVSAGIMGKNWIHIQDGTGDPKNGSHNLVATSDDLPAKGDIVTLKGTITKDKDFGSGYKYSVIMEKGSVQK